MAWAAVSMPSATHERPSAAAIRQMLATRVEPCVVPTAWAATAVAAQCLAVGQPRQRVPSGLLAQLLLDRTGLAQIPRDEAEPSQHTRAAALGHDHHRDRARHATLDGYASDVLDIADALDIRHGVFVDHSVSAMVGVLASIAEPDRFDDLVLVGPSPRYLDADGYQGGFSRDDIDELLGLIDRNYLGWSAAMAPAIMGNPDRPELAAELDDSFCKTDPDIAKRFARTTFLSDNRKDLPRVTARTLVLQCAEDAIAPEDVGAYTAAHVADSSLVRLDATGHCPNLSAPDETAAAIRTFLQKRATALPHEPVHV